MKAIMIFLAAGALFFQALPASAQVSGVDAANQFLGGVNAAENYQRWQQSVSQYEIGDHVQDPSDGARGVITSLYDGKAQVTWQSLSPENTLGNPAADARYISYKNLSAVPVDVLSLKKIAAKVNCKNAVS